VELVSIEQGGQSPSSEAVSKDLVETFTPLGSTFGFFALFFGVRLTGASVGEIGRFMDGDWFQQPVPHRAMNTRHGSL
jgi:hypothetical protein